MAIFQSPKNIFQRPKFAGKSLKFPAERAIFCQISGSEIWNFRARKNAIPYPQPFHTPTRLPPKYCFFFFCAGRGGGTGFLLKIPGGEGPRGREGVCSELGDFGGQESCRTKVSRIFRIFVPNFAPNFAPNFPPEFLEDFSCFVSWRRRPEKIHQKSPPFFNANFPGKHEKNIHKILLESRPSKDFHRKRGKIAENRTLTDVNWRCFGVDADFLRSIDVNAGGLRLNKGQGII